MNTDKTEYSEDQKLQSRRIFYSAERLVKLMELGAPSVIVEKERRLLERRISAFPKAMSDDEYSRLIDDEGE